MPDHGDARKHRLLRKVSKNCGSFAVTFLTPRRSSPRIDDAVDQKKRKTVRQGFEVLMSRFHAFVSFRLAAQRSALLRLGGAHPPI
jgi:hypothetical protein